MIPQPKKSGATKCGGSLERVRSSGCELYFGPFGEDHFHGDHCCPNILKRFQIKLNTEARVLRLPVPVLGVVRVRGRLRGDPPATARDDAGEAHVVLGEVVREPQLLAGGARSFEVTGCFISNVPTPCHA